MKQPFCFLLLCTLLACCTQMDQMEQIDYSVIKFETAGYTDLGKFHPLMEDYKDFIPFFDKGLVCRITAISYPSVDPNGVAVEVSGWVFHPVNRKSRGVIEVLPTAHMINDGGISDELYAVQGILMMTGYTVIVPDFIGTGISNDRSIPMFMAENTGRVAYDMRRAAARYLWDEFRYLLPSETIIMGYSLGGYAALAIQKYYETRHANTIKVKEVYASAGPYDLIVAFDAFANTGYSAFPAIPSTFLTIKHYYFDCFDREFDLTKVFKGALLNNYQEWFSGKYTEGSVLRMLGTDIHTYMHEDFFKPFEAQNETLQSIRPYLKENSLIEGWRPKAPIYMTHSKTDSCVPVECAEAAVKELRKAGANISFTIYPGDHFTVGYLWILRSFLHFILP
ncbi:MAG: alpha/beta fold hydrolase [Bacteroidetes bacterium]|nr:alpha/beta fold hydrolase [Bacteroidota bacterium]